MTNGPEGTFVYVMGADSTVAVRPVSVQRTSGDLAVIAKGVAPDEIVVTDGQLRLGPGARVVVRPGVGEAVAGGAKQSDANGRSGAPAAGSQRGAP